VIVRLVLVQDLARVALMELNLTVAQSTLATSCLAYRATAPLPCRQFLIEIFMQLLLTSRRFICRVSQVEKNCRRLLSHDLLLRPHSLAHDDS